MVLVLGGMLEDSMEYGTGSCTIGLQSFVDLPNRMTFFALGSWEPGSWAVTLFWNSRRELAKWGVQSAEPSSLAMYDTSKFSLSLYLGLLAMVLLLPVLFHVTRPSTHHPQSRFLSVAFHHRTCPRNP